MKKWIDLVLFYFTIILIFSGIVLYIMPHGRIAYWSGWKFLWIDKDGWDNIHVVFGIFMSIFVIWHVGINWKIMKKYLLKKESFIIALVCIVFIFGSVKNIFPFSLV